MAVALGAAWVLGAPGPVWGEVLRVGPHRALTSIGRAAQLSRDGDVVEIDAGEYPGDTATWRANRLTIRGVGGRPHVRAMGREQDGKAIWVVQGDDVTVENIELSGARVPDRNGAAIRGEGARLVVRGCYLHHNEAGILAGNNPESEYLIEHSEIAYNGDGQGNAHNIYISAARELTVRFSHVHHAWVGHNIKSRATTTRLLYNLIADERDGRSSYLVDLPNGGVAYLIGNVLQQGPATQNPHMLSYGHEGMTRADNRLYLASNTFVNELGRGVFLRVSSTRTKAVVVNNLFWGGGGFTGPLGRFEHNLVRGGAGWLHWLFRDAPLLRDPGRGDYRLRADAQAVDAGVQAGGVDGFDLVPAFEYAHPLSSRPRPQAGMLDIGAFEHVPGEPASALP
jgi:hypothetical protein